MSRGEESKELASKYPEYFHPTGEEKATEARADGEPENAQAQAEAFLNQELVDPTGGGW